MLKKLNRKKILRCAIALMKFPKICPVVQKLGALSGPKADLRKYIHTVAKKNRGPEALFSSPGQQPVKHIKQHH